MNPQQKTDRFGPVTMHDDDGHEYNVYGELQQVREQCLDMTWTKWLPQIARYWTRDEPVNRDGDQFTLAGSGTKLHPGRAP